MMLTRIRFFGVALATALILCGGATAKGPRAILSVIVDDMGWYDAQPHNPNSPTPNLGRLASEGIDLRRHYAYLYCSPTRRSFLTGRFPVHISGTQADICSNWTPLGMSLLSNKLAAAGFVSHFIGKTNIGFQTTRHMPVNRGFASHVGFLYGAEDYVQGGRPLWMQREGWRRRDPNRSSLAALHGFAGHPCTPYTPECIPESDLRAHTSASYFNKDFWEGDAPAPDVAATVYYSTNFYTERAISVIKNYTAAVPPSVPVASTAAMDRLWVHLCYQAVHGPFEDPPEWERSNAPFWNRIYGDMLSVMDTGIGNITTKLQQSGLWSNTLIIIFSDNGGPSSENNGPNNYPLRGSKESPWDGGTRVYAIISGGFVPPALRGTSSDAFMHVADWFGTLAILVGQDPASSFNGHDVDSINIWPMITGANATNPREFLPITEQSIIWKGQYKYFSSAQSMAGFNGWSTANNTMYNATALACEKCLFDILADPSERHDIAREYPDIVSRLSSQLATYKYYTEITMNATELERYDCAGLKNTVNDWPRSWPWTIKSGNNATNITQQQIFGASTHGAHIAISSDSKMATWSDGSTGTGSSCNQIALLSPTGADGATRFWVGLPRLASYVDIGLCARGIPLNLSGSDRTDWMGMQTNPETGAPLAWIYRSRGLFRVANSTFGTGVQYGRPIPSGAQNNLSVVLHSPTQIEFELNSVSQGIITLAPSQAVPADAVGCVGMCGGVGKAALDSVNTQQYSAVFAGPCCRPK